MSSEEFITLLLLQLPGQVVGKHPHLLTDYEFSVTDQIWNIEVIGCCSPFVEKKPAVWAFS